MCAAFAFAALAAPPQAMAQRNPTRTSGAGASTTRAAGSSRAAGVSAGVPSFTHSYNSGLTQIPSKFTLRSYTKPKTKPNGRLVGDADVTRQTNLVTYTTLAPGKTGPDGVTNNDPSNPLPRTDVPSVAQNYQPNWSVDERYIYFTSRRASTVDTSLNTSGIYNLYRAFPDGSGVTQISLPTSAGNQIEPNIAADGFRLAYAGGGTITTNASGLPTGPSGAVDGQFTTLGFKLYYVDTTSGNVTPLSERNPQGISFLDIRHPSWSPGGNQIAFAAKTTTDPAHYHIFKVNTDTDNITQLTSGPANETAPAWSPDGNVIAITTNASAYTANGANSSLVSQVMAKTTTDIWVINQNLFTPDSTQVTNSASVAGSVATNCRNAAWSTLRTDINGFVPSNAGLTAAQQLLAFASDRIPITTTTGTTTTVKWGLNPNGSTDIYFLNATVAQDAAAANAYTVTTPESGAPGTGTNPALPLTTSSSDLNTDGTGHNSTPTNTVGTNNTFAEYAARFDPNRTTNEDYPAWPQYIHSYRITFQSNSNGLGVVTPNENIWSSTITDINAPTLIKYDIVNNQVLGVFHDNPAPPAPGSDTNSYAREFAAGETVRFRVKVADYESGIAAVYLQIKCPDSMQQSSDNIEHKIFFDGSLRTGYLPLNPPYGAFDGSVSSGDNMSGTPTGGLPIEIDMQAINANPLDPGYGNFPQTAGQVGINPAIAPPNPFLGLPPVTGPQSFGVLPGAFPGTNDFLASLDDAVAFTGSGVLAAFTPGSTASTGIVNYWLQLHDNGPDPNLAHTTLAQQAGNEPRGEISGDGIWTGSWKTPANLPSDWVVDVIVFDKAIDPFTGNANNWKIYDNVWGLTTRPFQVDPRANILYVNDYDAGQKFFSTPAGSFNSFNGRTVGPTGIPTESWMTEYDPALLPVMWWNYPRPVTPPTQKQPLLLVLNTLGTNSYDSLVNPNPYAPGVTVVEGAHDFDGTTIPPTQRYVQWRILCRGPLPDSVLNAFAPRQEVQPRDLFTTGSQPRTVTVAERCVVWHSPYTGDLFIGSGTILDRSVQNQLTNFVAKGGRLFLSGQDLAFGLSNGNAAAGASAFMENLFHVRYVNDQGASRAVGFQGGNGIHPLASQTFLGPTHYYPGGGLFDPPAAGVFLNGYSYGDTAIRDPHLGACPNPYLLNTLTATATEQAGVFGIDGYYGSPASPNLVWATNAANGSKVVFSSLPFEAICPDIFSAPSPPNPQNAMALKNRRTELVHNILDYLRTGRIVGTIRSVTTGAGGGGVGTGGQALGNVFVRAVGRDFTNTTNVIATAVTQADGSYVLSGLDPTGGYSIDTFSAGFIAQHAVADYFHGGYQTQVDTYLTPAQPGSISGTVVVDASGAAVPGAIVTATDPITGAKFSATSDVNGAFHILNVPTIYDPANPTTNFGYVVRITNLANLPIGSSAPAYSSSTPYSYGLFNNESSATYPTAQPSVQVGNAQGTAQDVVLVPSGQASGSASFRLIAKPGTITGKVTVKDSSGTVTATGIPGATVTFTSGAINVSVTTDSTKDSSGNYTGNYTAPNLSPGTYQVTVSAAGYTTSASIPVSVVSDPGNAAQNFSLSAANPGSLVVTVTNIDGTQGISGATVTLQTTAGATLTFVTGATIAAPVESPAGTYTFASVPSGTIQVTVSKSGYKSGDTNPKNVTVTSAPTGGAAAPATVSFILLPKATFDTGLGMISAPQDYSTLNPAPSIFNLLGNTVELFAWNPTRNAYDSNSNPLKSGFNIGRTDTLHRGQGYWAYTTGGATLSTEGSPIDETAPFDIALQTGWNMIGDPYTFPVDFSLLTVVKSDNSTLLTTQSTDIGSSLFTYFGGGYTLSNTVDAYHGYWLYAYAPVRLRFSPGTRVTRALTRPPGNATGDWKIDLTAEAGDQHKSTGYLGVSRAAADGFDRNKVAAPPTIGTENVSLTFDHSEWGDKSGHYAVDVRSAGLTAQTWNFTVTSSVMNAPITLHWPSIATIPGKQSLTLTDLDSNHTMNLRNQNSYVIPASDKAITRHFSLQMTRAGKLKLQVSDVIARHTSGGRAAGVVVSYRISSEADVQVNILRNGQRIRTLSPSVHRAAGVTDAPWDMRDDKGVAVAGDSYTVEVRATDAEGNVARRVTPLLVTR